MSLGLLTRLATATTFAVVAYNLFLSTTHFHNNRAYLVIVLGAAGRGAVRAGAVGRRLAPAPSGAAGARPVGARRGRCGCCGSRRGGLRRLRAEQAPRSRLVRRHGDVAARGAARATSWTARRCRGGRCRCSPTGRSTRSRPRSIVLTELFIAVGLWWRGTRYAAVWVAVCFHVAIQLSASVEVFSFLGDRRAGDLGGAVDAGPGAPHRPDGCAPRRLAAVVRGLDWLARFRVEPARRAPARGGGPRRHRAPRPPAVVFVLSRLPLTAWFALPALLLPAVRRAASHDEPADGPPTRVWRAGLTPGAAARRRLRRAGAAGALPDVTADELRALGAGHRRLVRPQPGRRRHVAVPLPRRDDTRRPTTTWSATPGRRWASTGRRGTAAGSAARRRPGHRVGARPAPRARRLGRARRRTGGPPPAPPRSCSPGWSSGARPPATTRYDDVLRRLGRFLVAQAEPSGRGARATTWRAGAPVAGEYSKYYTGEAYWALARLHRTFPDEGWGEVADRIGAYLATERDDVEGHWPPIPDHWAAYGLSETVAVPRARPPAAHRRRGRLRPATGRAVRHPGALGEPAGGPWGAWCAAPTCPAAAGTASSARG